MILEEKQKQTKLVYECPVFKVYSDISVLPNGKEASRNRICHNGGSGVLPLTKDGQVILVEQYRYGIFQTTLEIPAGKLEKGESPEVCAFRELQEEVGCRADKLHSLGSLAVSPAYDSEIIYIYMAECEEMGEQHLDADEFIKIHKVPLETAVQMVMDGTIIDSKTQIAILKANQMKKDE